MFPFDHAHQHGIFSAWVNTTYDGKVVDFRNLAGRTGRVLHEWVALSGNIDGKPVNIAVLSHADNFRSPQVARRHPSKPYFCFAPCVDGAFTIDRDHSFKGRHRFLIADTNPDPTWFDQRWEAWCGE